MAQKGRRTFLGYALGGAAAVSLPSRSFAARVASGATSGNVVATPLRANVLQLVGAGGNVVVMTGRDGAVLVDGGLAEESREMLKALSRMEGGGRVQALFNTHWHRPHTGLNAVLGKRDTRIIAHENTKLWLDTEVYVAWENRTYEPLPAAALPNDTFYERGELASGNERISYGYMLQAHTDGDIYVYFHGANILACGDVVASREYPVLDYVTGGWVGGMLDATKVLLEVSNADTLIVPGTGPALTRANLQSYHDWLAKLYDNMVAMMEKGLGPDEMLAAGLMRDDDPRRGDQRLFVRNAYKGLWGHVRALGQKIV